jgi:hypothetical protein
LTLFREKAIQQKASHREKSAGFWPKLGFRNDCLIRIISDTQPIPNHPSSESSIDGFFIA